MSLLADHQIRQMIKSKVIGIDPFEESNVGPSSLDVRLDGYWRLPRQDIHHIDVSNVPVDHTEMLRARSLTLKPGEFVLGSTMERITLPDDIVVRVEGISSLGRLGVTVHITAGYVDPGFDGYVTLEIKNEAPWAITLHEGMRIGQFAFYEMSSPADEPYGVTGRYTNQHQRGPVESRYTYQELPDSGSGCPDGEIGFAS